MIGVSETGSITEEYPRIGPCLLGPISEETTYRRAASVAHALATSRECDLLVSAEAEVSDTADNPDSLPESHRDGHCSQTSPVETELSLDPVVSQHKPSALVIERDAKQHLIGELFSDCAERLSSKTDVLTVDGRGTTDRIASILVPIAGGHHSQLAVETAVAVARANDAAVDLFHVIESDDDESHDRGKTVLNSALATISEEDAERVDTWLYEASDATEAITEQSSYYDLTVMGAPTVGPLERFVFGSTTKHVQREADSPVIVAHAKDSE